VAPTFSFSITELVTLDSPVSAPAGIVYSTNPYTAEAENGKTYFVKGPELEIVFAEIAGCLLASSVGIPVPAVALCSAGGERLAGSEKVDEAFRDSSVPLKRLERISNLEDLYNVIVVDAWLGNTDRNLGNVLAAPSGEGRAELVMIDFEKSAALRRHPRVQSTLIEYRNLWPTGELGERARELRPLFPPQPILQKIAAVNKNKCLEVLHPLIDSIGQVAWADDSVGAVASRAESIRKTAEAVWKSI
jgi:hypothetical protein